MPTRKKQTKEVTKRPDVMEAFEALPKGQKKLVGALSDDYGKNRPAVTMKAEVRDGGGVKVSSNMPSDVFDGLVLTNILGVRSEALTEWYCRQIRDTSTEVKNDANEAVGLTAGLAFLQGVAPRDEIEGALAIQMFAVHNAMMTAARRVETAQAFEAMKTWSDQMNKLGRTFTAQAEVLAKLRGGGKQVVEVKHVYVSAQNAVVGDVHQGGGGNPVFGSQPHAAKTYELDQGVPVSTLWSEDAIGASVPIAGDKGQEAMPDARG